MTACIDHPTVSDRCFRGVGYDCAHAPPPSPPPPSSWSNSWSNASNASSPLQPSPPAPPPHPPCACQHISVTGAESVQSKRMGIYTRINGSVGARQLYHSVATPPVSTSTMTPGVHAARPRSCDPKRAPAPHARTPARTPVYSHSLTAAFVVAAKDGQSTRRPTGWPELTGQRARPPAHTRRVALGPRGMAAPSAATTTSRWIAWTLRLARASASSCPAPRSCSLTRWGTTHAMGAILTRAQCTQGLTPRSRPPCSSAAITGGRWRRNSRPTARIRISR